MIWFKSILFSVFCLSLLFVSFPLVFCHLFKELNMSYLISPSQWLISYIIFLVTLVREISKGGQFFFPGDVCQCLEAILNFMTWWKFCWHLVGRAMHSALPTINTQGSPHNNHQTKKVIVWEASLWLHIILFLPHSPQTSLVPDDLHAAKRKHQTQTLSPSFLQSYSAHSCILPVHVLLPSSPLSPSWLRSHLLPPQLTLTLLHHQSISFQMIILISILCALVFPSKSKQISVDPTSASSNLHIHCLPF